MPSSDCTALSKSTTCQVAEVWLHMRKSRVAEFSGYRNPVTMHMSSYSTELFLSNIYGYETKNR